MTFRENVGDRLYFQHPCPIGYIMFRSEDIHH